MCLVYISNKPIVMAFAEVSETFTCSSTVFKLPNVFIFDINSEKRSAF